jgi:hypothetical protein
VFIKDYLLFKPKSAEEVMEEIQSSSKRNGGFTITEVSKYEAICERLSLNQHE